MRMKQTLWLCLLTATYLVFEMAFNARLLDVVGGGAEPDQIHAIEVYGRSLSGIAAALWVLQLMLWMRGKWPTKVPLLVILLACGTTGVLTYIGLQKYVDSLVAERDAAYRRNAVSLVLIQQGLISGRAELGGFEDDPQLFSRPEGKAFLALLPSLAVAIERLDDKIRDGKRQLIQLEIGRKVGGPGGYQKKWIQAIEESQKQWRRYSGAVLPDADQEVTRQQDKAWGDYLADLGKRGWTPSSVPGYARGTVVKKVRGRVPVPADWNPADEATFREAVETRVRRELRRHGDGSVVVRGQRIPPGLSYDAFLAHPAIQAELRDKLQLPPGTRIKSDYGRADRFQAELYEPFLQHQAATHKEYDAPVEAFELGGKYREKGEDAARVALVPPIALFFSLLGAIGHMGKLLYLLLKVVGEAGARALKTQRPAWLRWATTAAPLIVLLAAWGVMTASDNAVTRSGLYRFMGDQARASVAESGSQWKTRVALNATHLVAVGQGWTYPVNEAIRMNLLQGISFGYTPPTH